MAVSLQIRKKKHMTYSKRESSASLYKSVNEKWKNKKNINADVNVLYNLAVEGDEPDAVVFLKLQQPVDLVVVVLEQGGWLLEEHLRIWFHLEGVCVRMVVVSEFY